MSTYLSLFSWHDEDFKDKYRACVHEAGHAVVAVYSAAANPERVRVWPEDGGWRGATEKNNPRLDDDEGRVGEITGGYGGSQAEQIVLGRDNLAAKQGDEAQIRRMLRDAGIPSDDWRKLMVAASVQANTIASTYQGAIEAVADHLMEHGSAESEADLLAIIRG